MFELFYNWLKLDVFKLGDLTSESFILTLPFINGFDSIELNNLTWLNGLCYLGAVVLCVLFIWIILKFMIWLFKLFGGLLSNR